MRKFRDICMPLQAESNQIQRRMSRGSVDRFMDLDPEEDHLGHRNQNQPYPLNGVTQAPCQTPCPTKHIHDPEGVDEDQRKVYAPHHGMEYQHHSTEHFVAKTVCLLVGRRRDRDGRGDDAEVRRTRCLGDYHIPEEIDSEGGHG